MSLREILFFESYVILFFEKCVVTKKLLSLSIYIKRYWTLQLRVKTLVYGRFDDNRLVAFGGVDEKVRWQHNAHTQVMYEYGLPEPSST